MDKELEKIHRIMALLPAFSFHLQKAAEIQREIAKIKLPLKRGRKKKSNFKS